MNAIVACSIKGCPLKLEIILMTLITTVSFSNEVNDRLLALGEKKKTFHKKHFYNLLKSSGSCDQAPPYLFNKTVDGNEKYEGYIKDLLDKVFERLNKTYTLYLVKEYGREVSKGSWNGMIGEVMEGKANISAGPLTVTVMREKVVDFTYNIRKFQAVAVMQRRHRAQTPKINSIEDLVAQNTIRYEVVNGSAVAKALKEAHTQIHKDLMQRVGFVESYKRGVEKASLDSNYAFITDEASVERVVNKPPCDFKMIPAGFFHRQFAFAVENQSPLRDQLNDAIAHLHHDGSIETLQSKWFYKNLCSAGKRASLKFAVAFALLLLHF